MGKPAHKSAKNTVDDGKRRPLFNPKVVLVMQGSRGFLGDWWQRVLKRQNGVHHVVGVSNGKVEQVVHPFMKMLIIVKARPDRLLLLFVSLLKTDYVFLEVGDGSA